MGGNIPEKKIGNFLKQYVDVIGGATKASTGKSKIAGKGGIRTAKKLGQFLGDFISSGYNLEIALRNTGYVDLKGKSASDIINHLIEYCSGPSIVLDDRAAKAASKMLLEEIITNAETIEELIEKLKAVFDKFTLEEIIVKYFGYYIYEHHSAMFYEKLVKEKGRTKCSNLFRQIKHFIVEHLRIIHNIFPLDKIKWGSPRSDKLIQSIYDKVLTIFFDYED
jgi:hypothetical protein